MRCLHMGFELQNIASFKKPHKSICKEPCLHKGSIQDLVKGIFPIERCGRLARHRQESLRRRSTNSSLITTVRDG